MSHWSTAPTNITNIEALKDACTMLGLTIQENAIARGYQGNRLRADYVIKLEGPYDVALIKEKDTFSIKADWWGGHVEKVIGKEGNKIKQAYTAAATVQVAKAKGYPVEMQRIDNGDIKLVLKVGAGG
ncbi:MAG TPA: DUF1257 domain-containing protein [Candidatus Paenibacillus intestinavium]|nr:DUF1257 domain-containing protein [Candidatus Paenibacillus intestinavium]